MRLAASGIKLIEWNANEIQSTKWREWVIAVAMSHFICIWIWLMNEVNWLIEMKSIHWMIQFIILLQAMNETESNLLNGFEWNSKKWSELM